MNDWSRRRWRIGACASLLLLAPAPNLAQVDWSDLFPEEGGAAAPPPAPKPAAAPAARPAAPPQEMEAEALPPKPVAPAPAPKAKAAPPPKAVEPQMEMEEEPPPRAAAPAPKGKPAAPVPAEEAPAEEPVQAAPAPKRKAPSRADVQEAPSDVEEPARAAAPLPPPPAPKKAAPAPPSEEAEEIAVEAPAPKVAKPKPAAPPAKAHAAPPAEEPAAIEDVAASGRSGAAIALSDLGLAEGDLIDGRSYQKHTEIFTPGQLWAVSHGMRIAVINSIPVRPPRAYLLATEKYSSQVRLGPDGNSLLNYTAGMPFPGIDATDPEAPKKIMWNFYHNFHVIDDVGYRNFYPKTGTFAEDGSLRVERSYIVDAYRKLNYTGRLYVDPKPVLNSSEGVRFKESVHPIIEPFDLKGVGFTSYRYLDPVKQDDSWLYLPQLRRVRRLSSAQRSDALLGQDTDADAFSGYNGQIAWMDFRLLGEKTVMAVLHARNAPMEKQKPQDWCFEEVWEPRRVWIIEAVSKFPQYAFGKRVLFVDQEAYLIPAADSYDRAGQLWKVNLNFFAHKKQATPKSYQAFDENMVFLMGNFIVDTQLEHATTTFFPGADTGAKDMYLINAGTKGGVTEDYFTVAHLIATGK